MLFKASSTQLVLKVPAFETPINGEVFESESTAVAQDKELGLGSAK